MTLRSTLEQEDESWQVPTLDHLGPWESRARPRSNHDPGAWGGLSIGTWESSAQE